MGRPNKRRRLLVRWAIVSAIALAATITWAVATRDDDDEAVLPGADVRGLTSVLSQARPAGPSPIRFKDATAESGIAFHHFPTKRQSLLPEDMGSGVAAGDFDDDGFVDLFFVNFSGNVTPDAPLDPARGGARLYRNIDGRRFEDVTARAGVGFVGYGMGAAWGDHDNDGDLDLYVTAYGNNVLYENRGDGTFTDVTDRCGVQDPRFSAGCAWSDYDRDGDLDLYVCNYVAFMFRSTDRARSKRQYSTEQPYTLNPSAYRSLPNSLFRNNGDGTFTDVAAEAGVADPNGRGLSAAWVDFDNDAWPDLYVANDVSNNGVFRNRRDGTFEDIGPGSLAADYRGAMGIAVADFDNDLDQDLLITHWLAQENALFRNLIIDPMHGDDAPREARFLDSADRHGLGQISLDMVGWATGFCDFDNDGHLDLWIVNGSTLEPADDHSRLEPQPQLLFWNQGDERFIDVAAQACPALAEPFVGRGGARLDYDRDGRPDLVILRHGGDAMLLQNVSESDGRWFRVELRQTGGNTRALGARVYVTAGGRTQMAEIGSSASYLSQDEPTLHFGLGEASTVDSIRIVWPDGTEETHADLPVDRTRRYDHRPNYPVQP